MELVYLNYKEPLAKVEDGHGYWGTLAQTKDGEEVQCHICGGLYSNLGQHVWVKHELKAREYRQKFKLGLRTPLCSDSWSAKCKSIKLEAWEKMSDSEREERRELMRKAREKTVRVGNPRSLESMNKDGMCPDQLIGHIKTLAEKLGKSPSLNEFKTEYSGKYTGAITRTFGSWEAAKRIADLVPCKSGSRIPHNKSEYTNELLLEFLRSFYKEKGYKPTYSDWRKGFLPSYYLYQHRFGGIHRARELAFLS